jgi:hypothetical protein
MKRVVPPLYLGAIVLAAGLGAQRPSTPARALSPVPKLTATADLRLAASDLALSGTTFGRGGHLGISPDGRIVVAPQVGEIFDLDSTGRRLSWKIPVGGRDAEIRTVERLGWAGSTMWIIDPPYGQIALVDGRGKITKSLEHPSWVRPSWADRRNFPVFGGVAPWAVYADGSWLVIPYRERSLMGTPGYDSMSQYMMRITEGGSIQRVIARLPRNQGAIQVPIGKTTRAVFVPYLGQARWNASSDAMRLAVVSVNARGPDSATFRVTSIGDKGDTVFSRLYPYTPVKIPSQARDSARERVQGRIGTRSEDDVRNLVAEKIPPFYPPVNAVIVGRDRTTWLLLHRTGEENPWLVLDPAGEPIGTVMLPKDFFLEEAERGRAWGFDRKIGQPPVIVRYRITPAARR